LYAQLILELGEETVAVQDAGAAARPRAVRRAAVLGAVLVTSLATASCGHLPGSSRRDVPAAPAARQTPGPVRTDPAPMVKRFPLLSKATSVTWQSGLLGDPRVPGPSSYWVNAVATMSPAGVAALPPVSQLQPAAAPTVTPDLRSAVPAGPWYTGRPLWQAFGGNGRGIVFDPTTSTVVIDWTGGN